MSLHQHSLQSGIVFVDTSNPNEHWSVILNTTKNISPLRFVKFVSCDSRPLLFFLCEMHCTSICPSHCGFVDEAICFVNEHLDCQWLIQVFHRIELFLKFREIELLKLCDGVDSFICLGLSVRSTPPHTHNDKRDKFKQFNKHCNLRHVTLEP